ncbi:Uu.00g137870.m01.CDS01 [Anthostomella pinea]|uniref:Uu.00g137870.m01.CDS01 n=1 Tax=Anthostomella pinea TaxID=933095 RepID=A0AAI8YIQ9_9PEZI|nr:Uu.00g137870.m01.CDS01 [Anthostomella pinea]
MFVLGLLALMGSAARGFPDTPFICTSSLVLQLVAGVSNVSAVYDNPFGKDCRALLQFADPTYELITYPFPHLRYAGLARTSFLLPAGPPNGGANVELFRAGGLPKAVVSDGTGDLSKEAEQLGAIKRLAAQHAADYDSLYHAHHDIVEEWKRAAYFRA